MLRNNPNTESGLGRVRSERIVGADDKIRRTPPIVSKSVPYLLEEAIAVQQFLNSSTTVPSIHDEWSIKNVFEIRDWIAKARISSQISFAALARIL